MRCHVAYRSAVRLSDPVARGFLAKLLAMAGHDLRQPLQIMAAEATARLTRMLDQLVEMVLAVAPVGGRAPHVAPTLRKARTVLF
jgi:hypothetical protein